MNPVEDPVVRNVRLALHHGGPQSSAELAARTGASVSTVQRALRSLDVLTMGRARATRHALRREIRGVDTPVALYEVTTAPRRLGDLHPVHPYGFGFVASDARETSRWFDDLPWFLHDLRPSGYLGRQVPLRHPELDVPRDVLVWSGDDVLRWATDARHDGIGAFVLGEASLARLAAEAVHPPASLCRDDRLEAYAALAEAALQLGPVGSSAAGEQPKLLARVEGRSVIVKISPPRTGGEVAVRVADLLVAEHLALETLRDHGHAAAASEILVGARTFLEVERFDRGPRRGQVMLAAADAEHVGQGTRWVPAVEGLVRAGLLGAEHLAEVRWLAAFGRWIGNTDMHLGNLSLTLDGTRISGLAPAYDMLPMAFAPVANEVVPRTFEPTLDGLGGVPALEVHAAAVAFWARVAADPRVSPGFQSIAASCREALVRLEAGVRWLGAGAP